MTVGVKLMYAFHSKLETISNVTNHENLKNFEQKYKYIYIWNIFLTFAIEICNGSILNKSTFFFFVIYFGDLVFFTSDLCNFENNYGKNSFNF